MDRAAERLRPHDDLGGHVGEREFLGEFEHLVLAAAMRLNNAYGASLIQEIEDTTGRTVKAGSLYITLERLDKKGFLRLRTGEAVPGRGGRPKRYTEVTKEGVRALAMHRGALLRIWDGLETRLEDS
jgi:DNA-binding PadR family transcriptional regulator